MRSHPLTLEPTVQLSLRRLFSPVAAVSPLDAAPPAASPCGLVTLTDAELDQVSGCGPNGGWSFKDGPNGGWSVTDGPNGGW